MSDLEDIAAKAWADTKPAPPEAPSPVADKAKAETGGKTWGEAAADLAARAQQGLRGADTLYKAGVYAVASPLIEATRPKAGEPESNIAGAIRKTMQPVFEGQKEQIEKRAANPQTVTGKVLGGAAEGAASMVAMPMGGGIARNVIAGVGMGEGSEIMKNILGGVFDYFSSGSSAARKAGEEIGNVAGGAIGAQANITRMKVMGEVAGQTFGAVKNIPAAYKSARAAQAAGDQRKLWEIFADEFGNLRANTRGIISQFTNRNLAAAINRNIHASSNAEDFVKDVKTTGINRTPWGLAEITMVPDLTEAVAKASPVSRLEKTEVVNRAVAMKSSIVGAYSKLKDAAKIPASKDGIQASAAAYRAMTQAKVNGLDAEINATKDQFQTLDPTLKGRVGEVVHQARDQMSKDSYNVAKGKYEQAEQMFDSEGAKVSAGSVREDSKDFLREFYSKVRPEEVPPVVRNLLSATDTAKKEGSGLILPEELAKERDAASKAEDAAGKQLSLKEANDLYRALGEAAGNALRQEKNVAFSKMKELQQKLLTSIDESKASPEAKGAFAEAQRYWAQDHAPRFQEGLGKALGKERSGTYEGREVIPNEQVVESILGGSSAKTIDTSLREADRVFATNPQGLKQVISAGVASKFRETVLDSRFSDSTFERKVQMFKEHYKPALDRVPELADKIDRESGRILRVQAEKQMELDRYKDLMKAPITSNIGVVQAKAFFERILADPLKMSETLAIKGLDPKDLVKEIFQQANPFKNGQYDPEGLLTMVDAGKAKFDSPSSMQILFSKAYGPEAGKLHMDRLEAIARFTKRQMATEPAFAGPAGRIMEDNPVERATGQKTASWISAIRSSWAGNTSHTYVAALGLSRFTNAKVQNAIEKAKREALYNPETAAAILEMSAKANVEPLGMTTAKKIFGNIRMEDGKKLLDKLIDAGYVKDYISRGLIYGVQKNANAESDPYNRNTARRLRQESQDASNQER